MESAPVDPGGRFLFRKALTQAVASDNQQTTMSQRIPDTLLQHSADKVRGDELHPADQATVLKLNKSRYTREHVPEWAAVPRDDERPHPLRFESDQDWLANTLFTVGEDQRLIPGRWSAQSFPTWPDNPELRQEGEPGPIKAAEVPNVVPIAPKAALPFKW